MGHLVMKSVTWCDKVPSSSACWTNREERWTSHKWLEFVRNTFLACTAVCHYGVLWIMVKTVITKLWTWCWHACILLLLCTITRLIFSSSFTSRFLVIASICWWATTWHRFCRSTKCNGHASLKSCRDIGFECTWPWVVDSSRL